MTDSPDSRASGFSADLFSSMHGQDQMAVDKLTQVGGQVFNVYLFAVCNVYAVQINYTVID
jgi:hypothetical protein